MNTSYVYWYAEVVSGIDWILECVSGSRKSEGHMIIEGEWDDAIE